MDYNGGCVIVMGGKNCIAIASDLRFGNKQFTNSCNTPRIFKINKKLFIALSGLLGDISSIKHELEHRLSIYALKEGSVMSPFIFTNILSNILYQQRFSPFLTESIICGLDENNQPFISCMDILGATAFLPNFAIGGTCSESLCGICETLWKPDLDPNELFEVISHCLILGSNTDCLSGWGGIVKIIIPDGIITKNIKTKID
nr:structural maintenance of chromosomes 2 [Cryptomonas sp.]